MIKTLIWKDYREQRLIWAVLTALALVLMVSWVQLVGPVGHVPAHSGKESVLLGIAVFIAVTFGFVGGASLLAGEEEAKTLPFLDALTGWRSRLWLTKFAFGATVTFCLSLAVAVFYGLIVWLAGTPIKVLLEENGGRGLVLVGLGFNAFAWSFAIAPRFRNVLTAAGMAAALYPLAWLVGVLPALLLRAWLQSGDDGIYFFEALLTVGMVWFSWRTFCQADLQRYPNVSFLRCMSSLFRPSILRLETLGIVEEGQTRAKRKWPMFGIRPLLWLTWKQMRVTALVLGVVTLVVAVLLPDRSQHQAIIIWPVFAVAVGLVCGLGAFLGEQAWGAHRFLGDQRLPRRIWSFKLLLWGYLALALCGFVWLFCAAVGEGMHRGGALSFHRGTENWLLSQIDGNMFFLVWPVYGFALGQVCGMMFRRPPVVAVLFAILSTLIAGLWWPSMICGGVAWWQALGVPLALVVGTRLAYWSWTTSTLGSKRTLATLTGCGVVGAAWMAGTLWQRTNPVANAEEPFDVKAYVASLPTPEQNRAGRLLHSAAESLAERETAARKFFPLKRIGINEQATVRNALLDILDGAVQKAAPFLPIGPVIEKLRAYPPPAAEEYELLSSALEKGWPAADSQLARYMDFVFEGTWRRSVQKLTPLPPGMWEDPSRATFFEFWNISKPSRMLELLNVRAVQLQARGDSEGALDSLVQALAVCRTLENRNIRYYYTNSREEETLRTLVRWASMPEVGREWGRQALDALTRHDAESPALADSLKAQYLALRNGIENPWLWMPRNGAAAVAFAAQVPWEKERLLRAINAYYAGLFREVDLDIAAWIASLRSEEQAAASANSGERRLWRVGWIPPAAEIGIPLAENRLGRVIAESLLESILPISDPRVIRGLDLFLVRGSRLQLALMLFQKDNGRPAKNLDELVPKYCQELPIDPFSGQSFRYRVSSGERIDAGPQSDDPQVKSKVVDVIPGQGVIWSVGLDGIDQGGRHQGLHNSYGSPKDWETKQLDLILLVPAPSNRTASH